MKKKISKILIANRGEIALRIQRAARLLDIKTVAIYSLGEEQGLHVTQADESVSLGEGDLNQTYLNINKIIFLAKQRGVDAIHPGYGFLSESAAFAKACKDNDLIFVGPSVNVLSQMGNKIKAKEIAKRAGVKVLSSMIIDVDKIDEGAKKLSYPQLIKASFGGGGKGMKLVRNSDELYDLSVTASRSAQNFFGNGEIYLEKYVEDARHIEVQILGDSHGNLLHLYDRDCTIQRNHQKIIEEAPAVCISEKLRKKLRNSALRICQGLRYENAGTVEFLVDKNQNFYFLEMNPRIQVEHCVTEEITGIDIVKEQLLIASGEELSFKQEDIVASGHAIQARLYQEDPDNNFAPSSSPINFFQFPSEIDLRIESDLDKEKNVSQFDPLLAKFIVKAPNRELAILHMSCSLTGTYVDGPKTNIAYLNATVNHPYYYKNTTSTNFCVQEHTILLEHIRHSRNQVDMAILLTSAIIFNHYKKKEDNDSVWNSMGFWRFDNRVELGYQGKSYSVNWQLNDTDFKLKVGQIEILINVEQRNSECLILRIEKSFEFITLISIENGKTRLGYNGFIYEIDCLDRLESYPDSKKSIDSKPQGTNIITSHLHGKIISVNVKKDQKVNKGEVLIIIESMKSENLIKAPKSAKIKNITVKEGSQVTDNMPLIYLKED